MIVVSDASPINYLAMLGEEELLRSFFGTIILPETVLQELNHQSAPAYVKRFLNPLPVWVRIAAAPKHTVSELYHLDRGERDAISIAMQLHANALLIDEFRGRKAAEIKSLRVIRTLGILMRAAPRLLAQLAEV